MPAALGDQDVDAIDIGGLAMSMFCWYGYPGECKYGDDWAVLGNDSASFEVRRCTENGDSYGLLTFVGAILVPY